MDLETLCAQSQTQERSTSLPTVVQRLKGFAAPTCQAAHKAALPRMTQRSRCYVPYDVALRRARTVLHVLLRFPLQACLSRRLSAFGVGEKASQSFLTLLPFPFPRRSLTQYQKQKLSARRKARNHSRSSPDNGYTAEFTCMYEATVTM